MDFVVEYVLSLFLINYEKLIRLKREKVTEMRVTLLRLVFVLVMENRIGTPLGI